MNDSPDHAQSVESCTDEACPEHRFDLFSALIGVADAWQDSLPVETRSRGTDLESAFIAIARLAAAEVLP